MSETRAPISSVDRRPVRSFEVDASDLAGVSNAIEDMYGERLDVLVVRGAFDAAILAEAGKRLDSDSADPGWARPNERMPVEDVQLLGTDTPATPTFRAPRGESLDAYLASAAAHASKTSTVFRAGFHAERAIRDALERLSGGRPVLPPEASDGRRYAPFTIRRLVEGTQIGIHHDYHFRLDLYRELSLVVDTGTLISYVATMRAPLSGGELFVYGATSAEPDVPKLANGFSYDLPAIEARYQCARFETLPGDLFLLASGRCLHRVGLVRGPQARVTMGGFLALSRGRDRVLFWS